MRKGDSVRRNRERHRPRQNEVIALLADGKAWQVRTIAAALGLSKERARAIVFDMYHAKRISRLNVSRSTALYSTNPQTLAAIAHMLADPATRPVPPPKHEYTGPRANSVFQWGSA